MNKSIILTLVFIFLIVSSCNKEEIGGYTGITISGSIDGHDYVDLGLSVKWATKNIGAGRSSDKGDLFAWGETNSKSNYDLENYKWYNSTNNSYTKYCCISDYGVVDNKTTLDPVDDAAHAIWGGSWRMPSEEEMNELRTKCDWLITYHNGVYGSLLVGPNGNRIFFPYSSTYWSSSNDSSSPDKAYVFFVFEGSIVSPSVRYIGRGIRPVTDK